MWDLIKQYVLPKTMLDIGAHTGEYYKAFTQVFPDCQCLLIDGNSSVEPFLKQLGVPFHIFLLGKENKDVTFYTHKTNPICTGNSIYRELSEHYSDCIEQTAKCHRLDDINKNDVIFDFVKIDAQGAELDIFEGGKKTFSKTKAIALETSITPYNKNAPLQHEVIKFMTDNNFALKGILAENRDPQGKLLQQDMLFVRDTFDR